MAIVPKRGEVFRLAEAGLTCSTLRMLEIFHALGLHMHQPPGNLVALHNSGERWEAVLAKK